jgi:hypothetical protein
MACRRRLSNTQSPVPKKRIVRSHKRILTIAIDDQTPHLGRYEVKSISGWVTVKLGVRIEDVCLFYELFDGTTGKVGPDNWRLSRDGRDEAVAYL